MAKPGGDFPPLTLLIALCKHMVPWLRAGTAESEAPELQGVPFFACCRYTCGRHQPLKASPEERTVRSGGPGTAAVEAPESQGGLLFCCQRQKAVGLQGQSRPGHQNSKGCHYSPAVSILATTAKQAPRDPGRKDTPSAPGARCSRSTTWPGVRHALAPEFASPSLSIQLLPNKPPSVGALSNSYSTAPGPTTPRLDGLPLSRILTQEPDMEATEASISHQTDPRSCLAQPDKNWPLNFRPWTMTTLKQPPTSRIGSPTEADRPADNRFSHNGNHDRCKQIQDPPTQPTTIHRDNLGLYHGRPPAQHRQKQRPRPRIKRTIPTQGKGPAHGLPPHTEENSFRKDHLVTAMTRIQLK
ncbi:hypothetical protein HPB47_000953 [Ixodes persulcatus]|uniref:Uncharacterized protein n=1 Tax=Ixodes persulcatus TaxID=34615 RepID=A0AC60PS98_IXOPE|nr:hypothetical protein HPB47_000953 [Ixodes persulcatus]